MLPCIFEGRYGITFADGSHDKGDVVAAVHQVPDSDAPSFEGNWQGSARALGNPEIVPVDACFSQDRQGAIGGRIDSRENFIRTFDVAGPGGQ
ncbi:MAG: hypothetical protein ACRDKJ_13455 [Actinomycetota bacterium]